MVYNERSAKQPTPRTREETMHEGDVLKKVIVCTPEWEYSHPGSLAEHNLSAVADAQRAIEQHRALVATLRAFGAQVIDAPELPGHPNSVFTRDMAVVTRGGFIRLHMGLPTRRGEDAWMAQLLLAQGLEEVGSIKPPSTAEGGDVILAGKVAFLGISRRTNSYGAWDLTCILRKLGYEVRAALVRSPSLHLGGMMSVVGPQQVLACVDLFPTGFFAGFEVFAVRREDFISGNVITLGRREVIAEQRNTSARRVLEAGGFKVHSLDLGEFVKGTGGPSCLILPVERG